MVPSTNVADTFGERRISRLKSLRLLPGVTLWMHLCKQTLAVRWGSLSLSSQFLIAASLVLLTAMTLLGAWISARIEMHVVRNTGSATAYYIDTLIEPLVQSLVTSNDLTPGTHAQLDKLIHSNHLDQSIAALRVWNLDGKIVYGQDQRLAGERVPQQSGYAKARSNEIAVTFDALTGISGSIEAGVDRPLFQVFAPMHEAGTTRVIGIVQVAQFGDTLKQDITNTRWKTFFVVGASTLGMLGLLFAIVHRGNQTIVEQRRALERQINDLSSLLKQNEDLNRRIVSARKLTTDTNERLLRRIGADLHDGPAQLLGLALLYYDMLNPACPSADAPVAKERFESVRGLLHDSLGEIRNISADIAPPHLDRLAPEDVIAFAIRNHEKRTGIAVESEIGRMRADLPLRTKTCLYRFVQEGLNNAFRHAPGSTPQVMVRETSCRLAVDVIDSGPGFAMPVAKVLETTTNGLGLAGLADRIETCDGTLVICTAPGSGTRLTAQFLLNA